MTMAKTHNINVRDKHGLSPLMLAAMLGDEPTVLALLSAGADVHLESNDSTNALGYARDAKGMDGIYHCVRTESRNHEKIHLLSRSMFFNITNL